MKTPFPAIRRDHDPLIFFGDRVPSDRVMDVAKLCQQRESVFVIEGVNAGGILQNKNARIRRQDDVVNVR